LSGGSGWRFLFKASDTSVRWALDFPAAFAKMIFGSFTDETVCKGVIFILYLF